MNHILSYELATILPSLFDEKTGNMHLTSAKYTFKSKLQIEISSCTLTPSDAFVIDGCAFLWVVKWPCKGTIEAYIQHFLKHIDAYLCQADTYLVFNRYIKKSIKEVIRRMRAGKEVSRKYQLSLSTPLPLQKVCLSVTQNKCQLIDLIFQFIFSQGGKMLSSHKLVVFGSDPIPLEVNNGTVRARSDFQTLN